MYTLMCSLVFAVLGPCWASRFHASCPLKPPKTLYYRFESALGLLNASKHCTVGFVTTEATENTVQSLRKCFVVFDGFYNTVLTPSKTLYFLFERTLWHLKASKKLYCQLRAY